MIGTLTISQAVIGFLGFLGINNFKELTNAIYGLVGMKRDGVEIIQTDNDVEIRKNGKLIIKFDVDSIEEMFDNTLPVPDFSYNSYEAFIVNQWDVLDPKPTIIKLWREDAAILIKIKYPGTGQEATTKIEHGDLAEQRLTILAELHRE